MLDAALGSAKCNVSRILESLGLAGHFALNVRLISGASRRIIVSRGTSAQGVRAAVLPHLARRLQLAFEPDVADYACLIGVHEIPDHSAVEDWPGIEVEGSLENQDFRESKAMFVERMQNFLVCLVLLV
eukprot:1200458-Amphidinium_carterae.1